MQRRFKFILDRKTLEKIYLTFIRPILEYADVVWNNKTLFLINKLENVQIEAARITRVPDKEWSFQDGGLYIIKKVGVKILTIIVLYMLA